MTPGPTYVYKCPSCEKLISRESIASGNTFDSKLFSDGKRISPMLPEFPDLTRCKKCNTIFRLSKVKEIGTYLDETNNEEWKNAEEADFLTINEYFRAIEDIVYENENEEYFIRQQIWWAFNDRIRNNERIFDTEDDEILWKANCLVLIKLLDATDDYQKIMIADLYRNLGNFEECVSLINSIKTDKLDWLKEVLLVECEKKNKWVIQLPT